MIELLTSGTPNGHKISILLEELNVEYSVKNISLSDNEQKSEDFLKLNPNGKIPVIIDHSPKFQAEPVVVFESGAIMIYLAEKYGKFLPNDDFRRYQALQWLMFQIGGIGPMFGQSNVFRHYAPEKIDYAINRYARESRRLLEVVNRGLEGRPYLAMEYSIADIAIFSWVRCYEWSGVTIENLDSVQKWISRISERPAVRKGVTIPSETLGGNSTSDAEKTISAAKNILI